MSLLENEDWIRWLGFRVDHEDWHFRAWRDVAQ